MRPSDRDVELFVREMTSPHSGLDMGDLGRVRTTPVTGELRAPYCLMGVCFECLVEIDGVPNQQGCLAQVREGMRIERQLGKRRIEL